MDVSTTLDSIWASLADSQFLNALFVIAGSCLLLCVKKIKQYLINKARNIKDVVNAPHTISKVNTSKFVEIQKELVRLKLHAGATRISILQFHNGESFSIKNPIFKFSCTYEQAQRGFAYEGNALHAVLVSRMMDLVAPLFAGKNQELHAGVSIVDIPEQDGHDLNNPIIIKYAIPEMDYSVFTHHAEQFGMDVYYACLLKSQKRNGEAIGILTWQYHKDETSNEKTLLKNIDKINTSLGNLEFLLD